ncbi:replicative DNA helicase [Streptomyces zaomyceticus]|uniref:replicative DNA helicase n=1 Tax=Streptomyces zaomyceticus TaxID=68286 RepID=UPI0036B4C657
MTSDDAPERPSHDLNAEKAVLRAMLRSKEAVAEIVPVLRADDFHRTAHHVIYTAILGVYACNETPDIASVSDALEKQDLMASVGGELYLRSLTKDSGRNRTWLKDAERVQALAVLRRTRCAAAHIENLVADGDADNVDAIVDEAQAEIFAATARRTPLAQDHVLGDDVEHLLDVLDALGNSEGALTGIPTGFTDIDAITGGLQPGQLTVIAARPAMGKSTLLLDLVRNAAIKHSLPSVLFTREMRRLEVMMRLTSAEARIALHHLRSGTMTDEDWTRLARRMPDISPAPLYIQDDDYSTFTDLRAHCRRMRARNQIRLIAVDAMHLLRYGTRPLGSRYEEISEISRCLKLLSMELDIPVVAVSTLNRASAQRTDRRPDLIDLRDSGALEDNADNVILIHREDAYEKDSPRAGEADLILAKHRQGPACTITVAFQGHYSRFVDMART